MTRLSAGTWSPIQPGSAFSSICLTAFPRPDTAATGIISTTTPTTTRSLLRDPTGLGALEWLEDLFKEKAPEEATSKAVGSALAALCVAQNCGKKRGDTELYGDCISLLNEWIKKQGKEVIAAISAITADGGNAVVSECAEICAKKIKEGGCCKNGGKQ